jgi:hypothetical protein
MPSRLIVRGGRQSVTEQMQPQVRVRGAGRRRVQVDLGPDHLGLHGSEFVVTLGRYEFFRRRFVGPRLTQGGGGVVGVEHPSRLVHRGQSPAPGRAARRSAVGHAGEPIGPRKGSADSEVRAQIQVLVDGAPVAFRACLLPWT